ncbi:MAG: T9SS type A sorting domain-containing protein, partial [Chitinophagales bacterium]
DNEGNLIIVGTNPQGSDVSAAKIDVDGNVLWSTSFDGFGTSDISTDEAGNTFILYSYSFGLPVPSTDIAVRKISPTGTELWLHNYNLGGGSAAELGRQIECDVTGNLFISGYGTQLTGMPYVDFLTFKIDGSGNILWDIRYNEHANNDEWPWMMVKDIDDNIYITGSGGPYPGGATLSAQQMITIKYDTNGNEQWIALHNEFSATGKAICLASDNSLFVAGQGSAVTIHYTQTTPTVCNTPMGLFSNNIATTKARLNWAIEPGAFQYEVWYKKTAAAGWKKKFVPGINNKLNLKTLTCNTNYVWKIRTVCDTAGVDLVSDFSSDQFFTTMACREENTEMMSDVLIYPNPAVDFININIEGLEISEIRMTDMSGKLIFTQQDLVGKELTINLNDVPAGIYFLSFRSNNEVMNKQIIVSK